ncbi:bifunctional aspartate kinase/homoserine dehydrogenase I [Aureibacter tunicatorum]|uniref:Aspartokinase/homoserine dehydrogenase 1 n=1 Tax=Aureibacter tunicatorum TaxID=866807 RepID=A0AAE3XKB5_9BACT|nr:bifunctional aspartate kinase/homoserine dehydrogenase I [Aureibacter tunicatorum]MDR6237346.1 aspartokinase/homoserine dehydrogenase 1 [Aureibacter tunicatorum]BDD06337.1 bifunctional aspartate kinase/homoserine dehydrogenase I [Aureibacter tunicatorum]
MKLLKFGGTSVGSPESIRQVAEIVKDYKRKNLEFAMVNSAMGGITNKIIDAAHRASNSDETYKEIFADIETRHIATIKELIIIESQSRVIAQTKILLNELEDLLYGVSLIKELSLRTLDLILSFGERMASYVISEFLNQEGVPAEFLDARKLILTDKTFGNAKVDFEETNYNIVEHFKNTDKLQVITGFVASTERGATTTLGRGGSDYTAAIFGAALNAESVEIWTDVDGVMTTDPRMVREAFSLPTMSYEEAMEMSHFGAKVIYPPTIQPLCSKNIPIYIKNTFNPTFEGTRISRDSEQREYLIKGISTIKDVALINLQGSGLIGVTGVSSRLFGALAKSDVNVILITQASSEHSISFAINPSDSEKAREALQKEFNEEIKARKIDPIQIEVNLSVLAIIGENMRHTPGISAKFFNALGKNGINVVAMAQGSSELNLSVVVPSKDLSKALNSVHDAFFLSNHKTVNLFVVGVGLIGGTLIDQIKKQADVLREKQLLNINVIGIARSTKMLFNESGINLETWEQDLDERGEAVDLDAFVMKMKVLNLSNSIFVDNTSSAEVIKYYMSILDASINITTPNKLASSGSYIQYDELKKLAFNHNVKYLYETNVGAGLPVLTTLSDLKNSGDEIISIEGVLSGTLSFIFNTYDGSVPFSQVVKDAKEKGFTEPDPRDDLNGMDVARKILILAREAGNVLELQDVEIDPILPQNCFDAPSIEEFFVELEKADGQMADKCQSAAQDGKVLRFIASFEDGKAKVSLQAVDMSNPFYSLSGSDNMISFRTSRYDERPLVIKGPGAGAEVTAAGVFAEIISISNKLA